MTPHRSHTTKDFHAQQFFMGVLLLGLALAVVFVFGRIGGATLLTSVQNVPASPHVGTVTRTGMELTATIRAGTPPGTMRISLDGFAGFGMELAAYPVSDTAGDVPLAWTIPEALYDGGAHLLYIDYEDPAARVTTPLAGSPIQFGPTRED